MVAPFKYMLELFQYSFFVNALLAGILASIVCGIIGSFIVVKKISFISGSIAHSSFGGIGLAYFLGWNPVLSAFIFAILSALSIGVVSRKNKKQEDTIIGAVWAIGMAIGLFFIYLTPGYSSDLFSYLFGNILLVSNFDILLMVILNVFIIGSVVLFFRWFVSLIFDEEFSRVNGIKTFSIYLFLLSLIAMSVIVLMKSVGIILVIALLTLPAATAQLLSRKFVNIIYLAIIFSLIFNIVGLIVSFYLNIPSGPIIIFVAAIFYLIAWFTKLKK